MTLTGAKGGETDSYKELDQLVEDVEEVEAGGMLEHLVDMIDDPR